MRVRALKRLSLQAATILRGFMSCMMTTTSSPLESQRVLESSQNVARRAASSLKSATHCSSDSTLHIVTTVGTTDVVSVCEYAVNGAR